MTSCHLQQHDGLRAVVPNVFGTRDWFHGRQFFHGRDGWGETGGGAQVVMQEKLCSLARPHLLLRGLVPNRPQTGIGLWPGGLGTPDLDSIVLSELRQRKTNVI